MIDFQNLLIDRLIIHTINPKVEGQDSGSVEASNEISNVDHAALEIVRTRLIDAAGRNSKAFELEIENEARGSFYSLAKDIHGLDNAEFIGITTEIGELLADCQRRTSIPGGYLLVMDCLDNDTNMPVVIVIKAEPHEALRLDIAGGHTQINLLQKVFLSPSQKLYKIGVIYQKTEDDLENINDRYGCFLYDDQFRTETHPAEYFYKDFLGFTVGNNSKIQSQRFFEKTTTFIKNNVGDFDKQASMLSALKNEFTTNENATVNPVNFAEEFIPTENGLRDSYLGDVCQELPFAIVKDDSLIKQKISKRKIDFPNNINLVGPESNFDNRVSIITDPASLRELNLDNAEYTIVKIMGRPYNTNE